MFNENTIQKLDLRH